MHYLAPGCTKTYDRQYQDALDSLHRPGRADVGGQSPLLLFRFYIDGDGYHTDLCDAHAWSATTTPVK